WGVVGCARSSSEKDFASTTPRVTSSVVAHDETTRRFVLVIVTTTVYVAYGARASSATTLTARANSVSAAVGCGSGAWCTHASAARIAVARSICSRIEGALHARGERRAHPLDRRDLVDARALDRRDRAEGREQSLLPHRTHAL